MSEGPPVRLRDDPASGRSLRADLARAAARPSVDYDVARGLARFQQALSAGAGAAGGTVLGAALKGALLGVAMVGGAALVESRSPAEGPGPAPAPQGAQVAQVATSARVVSTVPSVAATTPVVASPLDPAKPPGLADRGADHDTGSHPVAPSAAPLDAVPVPEAPPEAAGARAAGDAPLPSPPSSQGDALAAELEHLARLRAVQTSDPAQAIVLAAEGARRFPSGLFAQEREAIAIGALVRVGRAVEARARAGVFVATYPRSAFAERIKKVTGIDAGP